MQLRRCFVIMPFTDEHGLNRFFLEKLRPFLEELEYVCERADTRDLQNLYEAFIEGIYLADLVIADLTGANCNVYYELGIAHTIPKRTLMLSQSIRDVPFDVNKYNIVKYDPETFTKPFLEAVVTP